MQGKGKKLMQSFSILWMIAVFVLFVYYMDDYYFNLLETKAQICYMTTLVFLAGSAILLLFQFEQLPVKETILNFLRGFHFLDHAMILFALAAIMSNLVTDYKEDAFWGSYGWSVGTFWVVSLVLVYFFLSRMLDVQKYVLYFIGIATGLQLLLVILNGFYVDLFGLHHGLVAKDYVRYVGTIGNTNWFVGYASMLLPFFLISGRKYSRKLPAKVLLLLLSMTMITINSQGIFLGVGAVMVLYLFASVKYRDRLKAYLENVMILCVGIGLVSVLRSMYPMVPVDGIALWLMEDNIWLISLAISLVTWILLSRCSEDTYRKIKKPFAILCAIVILTVAVLVLVNQIQNFNDAWGTNRGRTWRVAIEAFGQMPVLQKLFGGGTNCFGHFYEAITGSDWVRNAHNEYLEYLVTTGIFGFICYSSIYFSVAKEYVSIVKHQQNGWIINDEIKLACTLAVLGYAAQALVNNPQALNGAMLITVLALFRKKCYTELMFQR